MMRDMSGLAHPPALSWDTMLGKRVLWRHAFSSRHDHEMSELEVAASDQRQVVMLKRLVTSAGFDSPL